MTQDERLRGVEQDVARILTEMRWHKWLLGALLFSLFTPKFGGPDLPAMASSAINHLT